MRKKRSRECEGDNFNITFPFQDSDDYVKKNVATLIREIAKHTPEVMVSANYPLPCCAFHSHKILLMFCSSHS